jgi:hypothetical protein
MRIALATVAAVAVLVAAPSANAASSKPERPTVVVKVSNGFHWTDAVIGAAAASGALFAIAGALQALKHRGEE